MAHDLLNTIPQGVEPLCQSDASLTRDVEQARLGVCRDLGGVRGVAAHELRAHDLVHERLLSAERFDLAVCFKQTRELGVGELADAALEVRLILALWSFEEAEDFLGEFGLVAVLGLDDLVGALL